MIHGTIMGMRLSFRAVVLYTTMSIYIASLLLIGLDNPDGVDRGLSMYGYEILMIGWLGIFAGVFPVYGYVLGIVSFFALRAEKQLTALISSVLGLLFGLQAIYLQSVNAQINFFDSYNSWEMGMGVLSIGYYVWIVALSLLIVQCVIAYISRK
jgi:hypothetical protein